MESSELTDEQLSAHYAWPTERNFRLNMVLDSAGQSVGDDGTSLSLSSTEDRRVLRAIRSHADVVIVGAQSVRAEGWYLPSHGRLAVLSQSGNLPWDTCPDTSRVNVYLSISAFLHSLQKHESKILCEGGLATAEAVHLHIGFDDIALTRVRSKPACELPVFLKDSAHFVLESELTEAKNGMTFQTWRRAVEHH